MSWRMDPARKATRLEEVAAQATLEPLKLEDPRYVDLSKGQDTKELKQLRLKLEDHSAREARFAKIAFTGHRGCGKTTALYRLEKRLEDRFTSVHLEPDEALLPDLDYTELMLWQVEKLADEFEKRGMPLRAGLVDDVALWFAHVAKEDVERLKTEVEASAEVTGEAKTGFYWLSLKMLGRLKSMVQGSIDRRKTVRRELQRYSSELVRRVNLLLDDAARVLEDKKREPDLLLVQDNLDRITSDAAERLFIENGDLLKGLRAHMVFTAPVAVMLSPSANIARVFNHAFSMPMVKTERQGGEPFLPGIEALVALIGARVELDRVFTSVDVARDLARWSGGSVRDLMRLLDFAQSYARVDDKDRIDDESLQQGVRKLRIEFERMLVPGRAYFPLLSRIHAGKDLAIEADPDPASVQAARRFSADLLLNGAVLEYNGDRSWFDVHPVIREIQPFKAALHDLTSRS